MSIIYQAEVLRGRLESIKRNIETSGWTRRIADRLAKVEEIIGNMGLGHLYEEQIRSLRKLRTNNEEINQSDNEFQ